MSDKKITDLQLRSNVNDDVNFPVDDTIQSYRVTAPQVATYILDQIQDPSPVYLKDLKSAGTSGGSFTSGAWRTRDLNTTENSQPWCSAITSNQFDLDAGTYEIEAEAPAWSVVQNKARLYNIDDTATVLLGSVERCIDGTAQTKSKITGVFTIAAQKTFEIQHWCQTTKTTDGFGVGQSLDSTDEVYTQVKIRKLA